MITPIAALHRVDRWWTENSDRRRLDRNAGNMFMLFALMLSTLSVILQGPVPNSALAGMADSLQIGMCSLIFLGCGIKLHGAWSGSRFYFPNTSLPQCYRWGYIGAPAATAGSLVYGWYILTNTHSALSALGGVATPLFGIGISVQAVFYWLEERRITRAENRGIKEAVARNKALGR